MIDYTEEQKYNKVKNLLYSMRKKGVIKLDEDRHWRIGKILTKIDRF